MIQRDLGTQLTALALGLWLGAASYATLAAAETPTTKQQLLELSGGRRVKVVWGEGQTDKGGVYKYFDTKDGVIRELPFTTKTGDVVYRQVWLTPDGRRVVALTGTTDQDRAVVAYDTDTKKVTQLATGPECFPVAVWRDPVTKRDVVFVNDCGAGGDRQKSWDAPRGNIYRFLLDKPEAREVFWDRTTSHEFFMLSADGTRACFAPNWGNIGQLTLVYNDRRRVDQDKSVFKPVGGGCFPGLAPDNSYRMFRLDGDHKAITMTDADGANPRKINITAMPGVGEKNLPAWLTRWSTDPRFLTCMAPCNDDASIWVGRFDEQFTKVEAWVKVGGPKCSKSHAWIEPAPASAGKPAPHN